MKNYNKSSQIMVNLQGLVMWMLIFDISFARTDILKDRFVVRENAAKTLQCIHKLKNVKRITWMFASTRLNISETIYDSETHEIYKKHFALFRQETVCNLKLTSAKKNDSGMYTCFIEIMGENETTSCRQPFTEIELVIRGPKREIMIASIGDSVTLPCEHNIKNVTRTRWSHVSLQGVHNYYLYYMGSKEKLDSNYEAFCGFHQFSCNLKILRARVESAGRYICMHGETLEYEEKYGYDEMTYFIEIDLVLGEISCNDNRNKDLSPLLGENDCYGIEPDVISLGCSFNYYGNVDANLFHLKWIVKRNSNSSEEKPIPSQIGHEAKQQPGAISIRSNITVSYGLANSTFQCVLENSDVGTCHLQRFKVQYLKNSSETSIAYSNDLHTIKCKADKSTNVHCSYYWTHEIGGAVLETPHTILPAEHMNLPGIYTCIGRCHLSQNRECLIVAEVLDVVQQSHQSPLTIGLIITLIALSVTFLVYCIHSRIKTNARNMLAKKRSVDSHEFRNVFINEAKDFKGELRILIQKLADESVINGLYPMYDLKNVISHITTSKCELDGVVRKKKEIKFIGKLLILILRDVMLKEEDDLVEVEVRSITLEYVSRVMKIIANDVQLAWSGSKQSTIENDERFIENETSLERIMFIFWWTFKDIGLSSDANPSGKKSTLESIQNYKKMCYWRMLADGDGDDNEDDDNDDGTADEMQKFNWDTKRLLKAFLPLLRKRLEDFIASHEERLKPWISYHRCHR